MDNDTYTRYLSSLSLSLSRSLLLSLSLSLTHSHAQDENTDEDADDEADVDDDEAEDDDDVEEDEKKAPNFIDMIDKVLNTVDPMKFLVMIEKLNAALPPPGQSVLAPFIVILQQACEVKAQLQVCVRVYVCTCVCACVESSCPIGLHFS